MTCQAADEEHREKIDGDGLQLLLISLADWSQKGFTRPGLIHHETNNEGILFVSDANCHEGKEAGILISWRANFFLSDGTLVPSS